MRNWKFCLGVYYTKYCWWTYHFIYLLEDKFAIPPLKSIKLSSYLLKTATKSVGRELASEHPDNSTSATEIDLEGIAGMQLFQI